MRRASACPKICLGGRNLQGTLPRRPADPQFRSDSLIPCNLLNALWYAGQTLRSPKPSIELQTGHGLLRIPSLGFRFQVDGAMGGHALAA